MKGRLAITIGLILVALTGCSSGSGEPAASTDANQAGTTATGGPATQNTSGAAQGPRVGEPFVMAFVDEQGNPVTELELTARPPVRKGQEVTVRVDMKNVGNKFIEWHAFNGGLRGEMVDQRGRTFDGEPSNLATPQDVRDKVVVGPADYSSMRIQPSERGWQILRFKLPTDVEPTTLLVLQNTVTPGEPVPVTLR
jgi:hypothetical protein